MLICQYCFEEYDQSVRFGSGPRYCSAKCRQLNKGVNMGKIGRPRRYPDVDSEAKRMVIVEDLLTRGFIVRDAFPHHSSRHYRCRKFISKGNMSNLRITIGGNQSAQRWACTIAYMDEYGVVRYAPTCSKGRAPVEQQELKKKGKRRPCGASGCRQCLHWKWLEMSEQLFDIPKDVQEVKKLIKEQERLNRQEAYEDKELDKALPQA